MSLACTFECCAITAASLVPTTHTQPRPRLPVTSGTSTALANSSATLMASSTHSRFCRLCPKEMAVKWKKGECYFCPEKFAPDHKCAMKGFFLMEFVEDDDSSALVQDMGISLHALTCLSNTNTTQLMINIAWTELRALVNSGSTVHTYLYS
jgi:hypothetical protein